MSDVEVVLGGHAPGQLDQPLEVGADDAVLGGRRRQALEASQLALGLLAGVLGKVRRLDPLPQLVDLGLLLVGLAELLLDRLQLLAQVVLALALLDLRLDLRLDLGAELDHLQLAGQDLREAAQPPADVHLLEQLLLLLGRDPKRAGDQVGERGGVVDVGDRELQLLGQVGDLLDDLGEGALHVAGQRLELGRRLDHVGQRLDPRHQVRLLGDVVAHPHPLRALDQDADRPVRDLEHPRDDPGDPDVVELVGPRLVDLRVARGDQGQGPLPREHLVDEPDRARLPDRQRRQRVRIGDHLLERQHRQRRRQRLALALQDRRLDVGRLDHLDRRPTITRLGHPPYSLVSIGTCREARPLERSGSATRSTPSS